MSVPNHSASDIANDHWIIRIAPAFAIPYLKLARADRPIGTWLLLLPCWWGMLLALVATGQGPDAATLFHGLWLAFLFAVGSFVMRGAGCTVNDMADREYDRQVARTALRPLASGALSMKKATAFLALQLLIGLLILLQLNSFTILLAASSLVLVAIYPFMKRITYWPQAWLGLTFNWGALVGWASITGEISLPALLLYAGSLFWTLGYDTIYAHQDKDDDAMIGVKSSALRLGAGTKPALILFYGLTTALWTAAGFVAETAVPYYVAITALAAQFVWQVSSLKIDDPSHCLMLFKSNRYVGFILCAGLIGALVWQGL
ncbi:4-hydroxybenzoate octaprenyltransferase [Kiloniella sp. b19]|uniref:4-hydroxybenzoate octaprenyltransferase n=1 Tax=Kiloniella sp. GXU_MW_B19 TaxID=3141326 RepID=UPI0031D4D79B